MAKRVLVPDPVCLTLEHLADRRVTPTLSALAEEGYAVSLRPPFPTVTCTAQATLTIRLDEGLVPWCYSKPVGFYERLTERQGEFQPPWYRGPLAGVKSSEWIARAALATLDEHQPTLTFVYLPHLDYNTQRFGADSPQFHADLERMDQIVAELLRGMEERGLRDDTAVVLLSEYTMTDVSRPVLLNRELRRRDLLAVRSIGGRECLDLELSPAFAMVDH